MIDEQLDDLIAQSPHLLRAQFEARIATINQLLPPLQEVHMFDVRLAAVPQRRMEMNCIRSAPIKHQERLSRRPVLAVRSGAA